MDWAESSGCIRIQPIPAELQSVLRKNGLELQAIAKQGSEVIHDLRYAKSLSNGWVQASKGMVVLEYRLIRTRSGLMRTSNQGMNLL